LDEIVVKNPGVTFNDIANLEQAKQSLSELVILPMIRPDLFQGLRTPIKGLLLFGPPGNGKTFLAKAVASEANATFFNISASSLTSKWMGDSEKLVKSLFVLARYLQPSIIFIDEIDSLLSERSTSEHEASRRLKTEFLVQFDGASTSDEDRILVMAATNRPQDIDEAARRRFSKRIYIPLPPQKSRLQLITHLLKRESVKMSNSELEKLAVSTEFYSCSDLTSLCKDAALEPIRELGMSVKDIPADQIRSVCYKDFENALTHIRPSVSKESVQNFEQWNQQFGSM